MFILKKAYCRMFQMGLRIALPFLPYREPVLLSSVDELKRVFQKEKLGSVLIVTDEGIVRNGLVEPVKKVLDKNGVNFLIYDKTKPNPTIQNVEEALRVYKKGKCEGIIAIGGGSAMDCAKALGARVVYPNKSVQKMKGILRVLRKIPPLIAIPTTAGTGSEVTLAAVITNEKTHHKYAIMSFPLIPHYAVLDAKLTFSLPPHLTATTGMDVLTHAVEAYIGRSTTKETRKLALRATRLVFENIETAFSDGKKKEAREKMLHAAYLAGVAFSKSYVGYIHAIAHSLGGYYGIPHGLANAVIMPYVLEAYGSAVYEKLHCLAIAAGLSDRYEEPRVASERFISVIKELNRRLNIPEKIIDIKTKDIPDLAKLAEKEANPLYPVPRLMTERELREIYSRVAEF